MKSDMIYVGNGPKGKMNVVLESRGSVSYERERQRVEGLRRVTKVLGTRYGVLETGLSNVVFSALVKVPH